MAAPKSNRNHDHGDSKSSKASEGEQRLQRILAAAGFGSRRKCEEYITEGRVEVDGEIVMRLGATADPLHSKIYVDGNKLHLPKAVYFILHKPTGVVSTNRDPQGRPRVIDLIPPGTRVFPVGRLDRNSEGLMLMTNDGALADQLTHPRYGVMKVYHVTVAGEVTPEAMKKMREGIFIAEGRVQVDGAKIRKAGARSTDMEISLREGKNREIRRILARLGHKVQKLRRVAIGPLRLGELPKGAHRQLTHIEVKKLKAEAAAGAKRATDGVDLRQPQEPERPERGEAPIRIAPSAKASQPAKEFRPAKKSRSGKDSRPAKASRPSKSGQSASKLGAKKGTKRPSPNRSAGGPSKRPVVSRGKKVASRSKSNSFEFDFNSAGARGGALIGIESESQEKPDRAKKKKPAKRGARGAAGRSGTSRSKPKSNTRSAGKPNRGSDRKKGK
ncbi:Ribosomal large subunit pseudouridine synthase B [Roseimaritima multifibrata]|uniref:Pseudouridine synthase n=2 Tax=Roseimaritima multifibrata TaxID=1930274 RepID=A0A517MB58_9BACT|nr:Ribosomal large subunit pseudouridine synthase B [Roseimaritima multifibrata]